MNGDPIDVMESMSTCRFAQRVALIKNTAKINEIEDPSLVISKQKKEIDLLKNELALVKGHEQKTFLEENDIFDCRKIANDYILIDRDFRTKIELKDILMIQVCISLIKVIYNELEKKYDLN
jgi:kinesin family protein 6/9